MTSYTSYRHMNARCSVTEITFSYDLGAVGCHDLRLPDSAYAVSLRDRCRHRQLVTELRLLVQRDGEGSTMGFQGLGF